eukprot:363344-Chlamydomonas_euryale.AAC.6
MTARESQVHTLGPPDPPCCTHLSTRPCRAAPHPLSPPCAVACLLQLYNNLDSAGAEARNGRLHVERQQKEHRQNVILSAEITVRLAGAATLQASARPHIHTSTNFTRPRICLRSPRRRSTVVNA